jgi:hypothetical protein
MFPPPLPLCVRSLVFVWFVWRGGGRTPCFGPLRPPPHPVRVCVYVCVLCEFVSHAWCWAPVLLGVCPRVLYMP